jgi:hypothetical protein
MPSIPPGKLRVVVVVTASVWLLCVTVALVAASVGAGVV